MSNPFFLRAWKVTLETQTGETITLADSKWGNESLKCYFSINMALLSNAIWTADVTIWNLNPTTEQLLLKPGDTVQIAAGYRETFNESTAILFRGKVYQAMWDRPDVTEFTLTLRCMLGLIEDMQNFVAFTEGAGASQIRIVQRIANEARTKISLGDIDETALSQNKLPRAKTVFGTPGSELRPMANSLGMSAWISEQGLNARSLADKLTAEPDLVFGPPFPPGITVHPSNAKTYTPTLIGTPQQVEGGVAFRVLLDSRIKIGSVVKLDLAAVRQMPRQIPGLPGVLDRDGVYAVFGVRHSGDTRGNDWYTEVHGVTRNFMQMWESVGKTQ